MINIILKKPKNVKHVLVNILILLPQNSIESVKNTAEAEKTIHLCKLMCLYQCRQQTSVNTVPQSHLSQMFWTQKSLFSSLKVLLTNLPQSMFVPSTHFCTFKVPPKKKKNSAKSWTMSKEMSFACFFSSGLIFVIIRFEAVQTTLVWWNRLFSSEWKQDQDTLQRIPLPDLPARTFLWENSQHVGCKDHFYTTHSPDTTLILEIFYIWKHRLQYVTIFGCQASGNLNLPL